MSMSTHVVGFRPPDEQWQRMKSAWDACEAAGVAVPVEVDQFFNYEAPDPAGVEIDLTAGPNAAAREWTADMSHGYEIDVAALPAGITTVRFFNSF